MPAEPPVPAFPAEAFPAPASAPTPASPVISPALPPALVPPTTSGAPPSVDEPPWPALGLLAPPSAAPAELYPASNPSSYVVHAPTQAHEVTAQAIPNSALFAARSDTKSSIPRQGNVASTNRAAISRTRREAARASTLLSKSGTPATRERSLFALESSAAHLNGDRKSTVVDPLLAVHAGIRALATAEPPSDPFSFQLSEAVRGSCQTFRRRDCFLPNS